MVIMDKQTKKYEHTHKLDLYLDADHQLINQSINFMAQRLSLVRKEQVNALKIVLLNLFVCRYQKIRVSRARKAKIPCRYNPLNVGYSALITILDKLSTNNWIHQEIGKYDLGKGQGTMTTIMCTTKLCSLFDKDLWSLVHIKFFNHELVRMRKPTKNNKSKDRKFVNYIDSGYSTWVREILTKYNALLQRTKIYIGGKFIEDFVVSRVFIDYEKHDADNNTLFAFGGRMYGPWCNFSKSVRATTLLNDEKTVEIDYEAAHVNAMYKSKTGKFYQHGDPYHLVVKTHAIPRGVVKQFATIMQNTTFNNVIQSIEAAYRKPDKNEDEVLQYKTIKQLVRPIDIIYAYLKKHDEVASYYLKDKMMGSHIQHWESDMLFEVVKQLTDLSIPALTVYDSVIVQEQHYDLAFQLMHETPAQNRVLTTTNHYIKRQGIGG
jgi:hypothetical protein